MICMNKNSRIFESSFFHPEKVITNKGFSIQPHEQYFRFSADYGETSNFTHLFVHLSSVSIFLNVSKLWIIELKSIEANKFCKLYVRNICAMLINKYTSYREQATSNTDVSSQFSNHLTLKTKYKPVK